MPYRRLTVTLTLAGLLTLGVGALGPQAGIGQTPPAATPAPGECSVAPLPAPVWDGVEIAEPTAPVSVEGPFTPPTGTAVDDDTLAGVTATITESIACQNAGDVARTLALFTPDAVRAFFSGPRGFDAASVDATVAAGAVPVAEGRVITLVSIGEVTRLADGRVGAVVTTTAGEVEYVDFLFLAQGEAPDGTGRWLIDASIAIDGQTQVSGEATTIP